jgi:hypothetical protein
MNRKILAINPELARNISIELTPTRLILMPFIIFLLAGFYSGLPISRNNGSLMLFSTYLFYIITIFWGCKNISESVLEEFNVGTWDWQRMSTLSPWKMTIGKLFGSTIYNWYGGAFCILIYLFSAMSAKMPLNSLVIGFFTHISSAIFIHSIMLMITLLQIRRAGERTKLKSANWLLIIPIIMLNWWSGVSFYSFFKMFSLDTNGMRGNMQSIWYGLDLNVWCIYLLSLTYPIWSVAGVYRSMRTELQYKNGLKWWVAFLITAFIYNGGYLFFAGDRAGVRLLMMSITSGISYFALSYVLLMFEPIEITAYRRILHSIKTRDFKRLWTQLPLWPVTYFAFTLLLIMHIVLSLMPDIISSETPEYISNRYTGGSVYDQNSIGLVMLFYGIRDICIIIIINLLSKKKRANFSSILYLILVYLVLPILLRNSGLASFLSPFNTDSDPANVLVGIVEAALAVYALVFVWRQYASKE